MKVLRTALLVLSFCVPAVVQASAAYTFEWVATDLTDAIAAQHSTCTDPTRICSFNSFTVAVLTEPELMLGSPLAPAGWSGAAGIDAGISYITYSGVTDLYDLAPSAAFGLSLTGSALRPGQTVSFDFLFHGVPLSDPAKTGDVAATLLGVAASPVPEPATCGSVVAAFAAGLLALRRARGAEGVGSR